ncbi:MAG TPA: beta-propeller fold lactonase family protein [Acetobacteraceae bacterium]|nr:beta-propeller fold lactonase family protein [Acetobacteraceae bacterium]
MNDGMKFSRRRLIAAPALGMAGAALARTGFAAEAAAGPGAPPIAPPIAIVMNSGGATVSEIDMTTRRVLREVPTFREPSHWALTPDLSRLLVSDASGNALFFLDPSTGKELGHKLIPDPYQLWFSPDGKYLTVNALRLNHVDVYHADTLKLARRFRPGSMPSHLAYRPDSRFVYVSLQGSNALCCFDLHDMSEKWRAPVGKTPAGVLWHDGRLLVAIMGADHVVVADPASGRVLRRIVTARGAHNLFRTPDERHIYVTNRVAGSLSVLDAASLDVVKHIPMPGGPDDLCFAPDGKLWISLRFAEAVAVYDPVTGGIERIGVGRSPHGIFISTLLADGAARKAMAIA